MKATQYLINNFKWTFSKPDFSLLGQSSTVEQLYGRLQAFCQDVKPTQMILPNCHFVQFSLNQVLLGKANNDATRHLKTLYFHYASMLKSAQATLETCPQLPAQNGQIVLESLAKMFVSCTQASKQPRLWQDFCNQVGQLLVLEQSHIDYLNAFYQLHLCNYYCMLYKLCKKQGDLMQICNLTTNFDLVCHKWIDNCLYSRNFYKTSRLFSALDCFCNSATIFDGKRTDVVFNACCNFNNRNCFDTFMQYKYGGKSANFRALGKVLDVNAQYHCYKNMEVRKYLVTNKTKGNGKLDFVIKLDLQGENIKQFTHEQTCCFSKSDMYLALLAIVDGNVVPLDINCTAHSNVIKGKSNVKLMLQSRQSTLVQFVTIYAKSIADLTQSIEQSHQIGFTNCFAYTDKFCEGEISSVKTNITLGASNLCENTPTSPAKPLKYCYQLGNERVSTLVDSNGNNATLVDGFISNGGEGVYAVAKGKIVKLNCGTADIVNDNLVYLCPSGELTLQHTQASKVYQVTTSKPSNVLFLLPLEQHSVVRPVAGGFEVSSNSRKFSVKHNGVVQALTTNALECNPSRLRCKLSGDLTSGNTLAIYFQASNCLQIELTNQSNTHKDLPLIEGNVTSAYLDCYNQKTVYNLTNMLGLPNPLTLISTAYTHPRWLKNYLLRALDANCEYAFYNPNGKLRYKVDVVSTCLAGLHLSAVTGDNSLLDKLLPQVETLLNSSISIAYKALLVKRLAQLDVNKVANLVRYANYKKQIVKDKQCYLLAQAIGAVQLNYPSKQRLKDLCNQLNLPKCWQYVATFELLYNLQLAGNKVSLKPVASSSGFVAENFVLNLPLGRVEVCFQQSKIPQICRVNYPQPQQDGTTNGKVVGKIAVKY